MPKNLRTATTADFTVGNILYTYALGHLLTVRVSQIFFNGIAETVLVAGECDIKESNPDTNNADECAQYFVKETNILTTAEILAAIETLKSDPLAGEDQFLRLYDLLDMTEEERIAALDPEAE